MGDAQIEINESVRTKMEAKISKCFDDAVSCVDGFDSGRLMLTKKHVQDLNIAEASRTDLLQQLAAAQREVKTMRKDTVTAIDNVLGTIAKEIEEGGKDSGMTAADVLNKIALHRSLMDNSIIYSALTVSTDLPPLKEMASVMKHAVSSSKHQKNYDKFSEKINSMSPDTAADKLERLHQKMISAKAIMNALQQSSVKDKTNKKTSAKQKKQLMALIDVLKASE
jgi:hypothetical protein